MKCRKILLKIRDQREKEIKEYTELLSKISTDVANFPDELLTFIQTLKEGKLESANIETNRISFENIVKKRRLILLLEFPFKTDAISANQALTSPTEMVTEGENAPVVDADWNREYQENSLANSMKAYSVKYNSEGQMTTSMIGLKVDDLQCALPQEILIKNIDAANLKKNSKRTYRSNARKIGLRNKKVGGSRINYPLRGLDYHTLAAYFNYLEERCLNSDLLSHYEDLVGVRLLFYVSLESKLLNECTLSNIDELVQCLRYRDHKYNLPQSYIELAKSVLPKKTPLLQRNTKQLNKFVSQTSNTIGLKGKITPTLIRRSQNFIAYQEGYLKEKLPRR